MADDALLGQILERIRIRSHQYFPDLEQRTELQVKNKISRAYSQIYRVALTNSGHPQHELIIKVFPDAEQQFRAMKALWPRFAGHSTWRIPKPLDLLEEGPALVTEFVPAPSLHNKLPWMNWRGAYLTQAQTDCYRAAQWLRFYHSLARDSQCQTLDIREKLEKFGQSVSEMVAAGFDDKLCHRLSYHLCVIAERLARQPRPFAKLHGDFSPDNILVDGSQITVLDISSGYRNAVDHDIASFLNSLLFLRFTRPIPWPGLQALRQAFLDGYFGPVPRDEDAIVFLQGIGLIDVVLEILSRRRFFFPRWWLERRVAGTINLIVRNCEAERGL